MIKRQTLIMLAVLCMMSLFATTASANGVATIGIGDGSGYVAIPIFVTNSTDVGSMDVTLRYDPSIVIVVNVADGDMSTTISNLEHVNEGWIRIVAYQVGDAPSSTFVLANVSFEPVGSEGDSCPLEISVTTFSDATPVSNAMPYTVYDGTYSILYGDDGSDDMRSNRDGTYPPETSSVYGSNETVINATANETPTEVVTAPPVKMLPGNETDDDMPSGSWLPMAVIGIGLLGVVALVYTYRKSRG